MVVPGADVVVVVTVCSAVVLNGAVVDLILVTVWDVALSNTKIIKKQQLLLMKV